jgi:hypothetical protein
MSETVAATHPGGHLANSLPETEGEVFLIARQGTWVVFSLAFASLIFFVATPYMGMATLAFCLMNLGLMNRKVPRVHATYMVTAIAIDLGIVLVLEVQRHAIKTAMALTLSPLQQGHIGASSVATLLYFPILYLGWRGIRHGLSKSGRLLHMRLGIAAYVFRSIGFILMFALLGRHVP